MKTIASTILAITLLATPALASQPLLFEWSGVDSNSNPFSVAFTVTDVQSSDTNYDVIDFGDPAQVEITTEELTHDQIVTNVTSGTFGGSFTYPSSTLSDPYGFLFSFDNSGVTFLSIGFGADDSDIGLTFNGDAVTYVTFSGDLPLPWVDPTTVNSLSELFPVGTYAVTGGFGNIDSVGGTASPTPDTLTISQIPEPTTAALLGLGGVALMRRRR